MDKLKDCPFCGCSPVIRQWPVSHTLYIECINRKCKMQPSTALRGGGRSLKWHFKIWNTRAEGSGTDV